MDGESRTRALECHAIHYFPISRPHISMMDKYPNMTNFLTRNHNYLCTISSRCFYREPEFKQTDEESRSAESKSRGLENRLSEFDSEWIQK